MIKLRLTPDGPEINVDSSTVEDVQDGAPGCSKIVIGPVDFEVEGEPGRVRQMLQDDGAARLKLQDGGPKIPPAAPGKPEKKAKKKKK
jgi:hypothetical protein